MQNVNFKPADPGISLIPPNFINLLRLNVPGVDCSSTHSLLRLIYYVLIKKKS